MHLHSIEIDHCRGLRHFRLDEIPERGVLLITGPNEAGKSTVFEALEALFTEKHSSKKSKLKDLVPADAAGGSPTVTVECTLGGQRLRMRKTWVRSADAQLDFLEPRGTTLRKSEADERFDALLEEHFDRGLFRALFVKQGELTSEVDVTGVKSVEEALQQRAGTSLTEVGDANGLVERAKQERLRYYTQTGGVKKKGPLDEAQRAVAEAQALVADYEEQQADLNARLAGVEAAKQRLERDLAAEPEVVRQRREDQQRFDEADALRQAQTIAEHQLAVVRGQTNAATEAVQQRAKLRASLEQLEQDLANAKTELEEAVTLQEQEQESLAAREAEVQQARERRAKAQHACEHLEHQLRAHEQAATLDQQRAVAREVREIDERLHSLDAVPTVEHGDVERADALTTDVQVAQELLKAKALRVFLRAELPTEVHIDGTEITVDPEHTVTAERRTQIEIGDVTVEVEPPEIASLEHAEQALQEYLQAHGVDNIAELRRHFREAEEAQQEAKALRRRRRDLLGESTLEELQYHIEQLAAAVAVTTNPEPASRNAGPSDSASTSSTGAHLDPAAIEVELREARELLRTAHEAVTRAEVSKDKYSERPAAMAVGKARGREEALRARRNEERERLEAAVAAVEDAELHQQVEHHTKRQQELELAFNEASEKVDEAQLAALKMARDASAAAFENLRNSMVEANAHIEAFEANLRPLRGLAENLSAAQDALHQAKRRHATIERQAQAAKRLFEVLEAHQRQARERYSEPLQQALQKYAAPIFSATTAFELNQDLRVTQRVRDGIALPVLSLSGGAQEQLGLVARFALAEIASDAPCPVFIDDPLGNTDDERLTRMGALFAEAGKYRQIIVCTCAPGRFRSITGLRERPMAELTAASQQ